MTIFLLQFWCLLTIVVVPLHYVLYRDRRISYPDLPDLRRVYGDGAR